MKCLRQKNKEIKLLLKEYKEMNIDMIKKFNAMFVK